MDKLIKETSELSKFKEWVEQTALFQNIVTFSGNPHWRLDAFTEDELLSLQLNHKKISTFEELPKELLFKFFENYPNKPYKSFKQLEDGDTIQEIIP